MFGDEFPIILDSRLAETNPGEFGTWLEEDFNAKFPFFKMNVSNRYKNGESHLDMMNRVQDWIEENITSKTPEKSLTALVSHGGPISVILQVLLKIPLYEYYPSFVVSNASFSFLKWNYDLKRYYIERVGQTIICDGISPI